MENLDVLVLRALRDWRAAGRRAMLATVVRTWGSSPRPIGSIMALCESGAVVGSVSGGCIEDDLIDHYTRLCGTRAALPGLSQSLVSGAPQRLKYGISADEAHRFGLPCGGTLELVLEYDADPVALETLIAAIEAGRLMSRVTDLNSGVVTQRALDAPDLLSIDDVSLANTFGPEFRMLLIGAGQLSEYLAAMALACGFAVTVCDPREEYSGVWSLPGARLDTAMPDDVVLAFKPDRRSAVIALCHDPKLDDLALIEALASDAFYIGAIGSRKNNAARRQRLIEHFGHTTESLARLRGPVGLYIGSKTPPEIAVSIMAEVLAVKNGAATQALLSVGPAKDRLATSKTAVCGSP